MDFPGIGKNRFYVIDHQPVVMAGSAFGISIFLDILFVARVDTGTGRAKIIEERFSTPGCFDDQYRLIEGVVHGETKSILGADLAAVLLRVLTGAPTGGKFSEAGAVFSLPSG